jgi:hypothetical protein
MVVQLGRQQIRLSRRKKYPDCSTEKMHGHREQFRHINSALARPHFGRARRVKERQGIIGELPHYVISLMVQQ